MAKIILNNKEYTISDSVLASAIAELKSHLSTTMSGSGATIELGGVAYNIDATKLSTATNNFVAHLGTIAGEGTKIKVGNVEYSVDSAKIGGAMSELGTAFGELENGGSSDSDSVVGTWVFNDEISLDGFPENESASVSFMCDGLEYFSLGYSPFSSVYKLNYSRMGEYSPIADTVYYTEEIFGLPKGWQSESYKTITILEEPTDPTFITWLKANATKVGDTPEVSGKTLDITDENATLVSEDNEFGGQTAVIN